MEKFRKDSARSVLVRFEADTIGIIYNSLIHSTGKYACLKLIKKELAWVTSLLHLDNISQNLLYLEAYSAYNKVSKASFVGLRKAKKQLGSINYQENLKMRSNVVFDRLNSDVVKDRTLLKTANKVLNRLEFTQKRQNLRDMVDEMREKDVYSPFYICSYHKNCAKDHLEWQGRIYVDENWRSYIDDEELEKRISAYIRNHRIKTIQFVTGDPVWMTTRPNCKHYFSPVGIDEVLGASVKSILKRKGMIVEDAVLTDRERYLRGYKERYELHKKMWSVMPCEQLSDEMKQDRTMIAKWARSRA